MSHKCSCSFGYLTFNVKWPPSILSWYQNPKADLVFILSLEFRKTPDGTGHFPVNPPHLVISSMVMGYFGVISRMFSPGEFGLLSERAQDSRASVLLYTLRPCREGSRTGPKSAECSRNPFSSNLYIFKSVFLFSFWSLFIRNCKCYLWPCHFIFLCLKSSTRGW